MLFQRGLRRRFLRKDVSPVTVGNGRRRPRRDSRLVSGYGVTHRPGTACYYFACGHGAARRDTPDSSN